MTAKTPASRVAPLSRSALRPWHVLLLILFGGGYLGLMNLGYSSFWDDESEVAIVGKTLLHTGKFSGWDGRNLFGYHAGTLLDKDLRPINPPLEYLLAAASFKVFGVSTWAGRLPFALLGVAGLVLFAAMLRKQFKEDTALWVYAVALLAFSVTFLLHIRQCRYYPLTLFFSLLTFYFYEAARSKRRTSDFIGLGLSAAMLFYSHYLICAAFLFSLGVVHLVFWRKELTHDDWLKFSFSGVVFLFATVPYAMKYKVWVRPDLPQKEQWLTRKLQLLAWTARDINALNALPWIAALAIVCVMFVRRREPTMRKIILPWVSLGALFLLFLALLSEVTVGSDESPIRYFLPAVPFLCVGIAALLSALHARSKIAAAIVFAILVTTNLFSWTPSTNFRWLLPAFVREIHHDYQTPYRAAAEFIEKEVPPDATVFCFPDFCTYPLMFYTGDKVFFSNLLDTREEMNKKYFAPGVMQNLPDRVFFDVSPDYVIAFGRQPETVNILEAFSQPQLVKGREVAFEYQLVKHLDVFWYDTSRPELTRHTFEPRKDFDPNNDAIFVFKRVVRR